ncbi:hypothetical protein CfE428DRAFT_4147 [Chthoniobacter flavus Ellin428]|uniref:Glycosyltransferase RgtA/B/C/D-like domain-containing protein n=1 Tax=Chthoniobacter flavus Ellin428 TaxID=497964 RepID=B4D5F8_9BACT|nr:hypothetical protein [Chthoniobacter flavus]EDY18363.1 hypothetical protein CfE428DRAFT_4147 [Chthoniobacter flavus Ellin428]TCO91385.1 hypothetical protein EV701_108113 [Chthoniobacter flavus]
MTSPNPSPAVPVRTEARLPSLVFRGLELLILAIVLTLAWKSWSAWPMVPLADPDTWGYLNPALSWLSGTGFVQAGGRDWLYPAFVALFLKTTGSFTGIVAWQKCIGLLSGVLMAITWRCWVSMLPFHRGIRFAISLLGAMPIFMQLVNPQSVLYQMSLRPESLLPCFVYAQLACAMGYCRFRWHTPKPLPSLLLGAAALVFAYACFLLKPSWYLATVTTSLSVGIGLFGSALSWRIRLLTPVTGIAAALLILALPARMFFVRDGASVTLLPLALFCVHAPLIDESFTAKLAHLPDSAPEKPRLQHLDDVLKGELAIAADHYRPYDHLRINPDYLLDSRKLNTAIPEYAGATPQQIKAFCFGSFASAVLHDPGAYTRKVFLQFHWFLWPDAKTFFKDRSDITGEYRLSAESLTAHQPTGLRADWQTTRQHYQEDLAALAKASPPLAEHPKLTELARGVTRWALPLECLFLLALLAVHVWPPLCNLRSTGWAAFFLFLAPLGNAFGVCIVHALDIYRYRITYGGYWLFVLTAMTAFIFAVAGQALYRTAGKIVPQRS